MYHSNSIEEAAAALVRELLAAGKAVATAESCTGGWVATAITGVAGSSGCFSYGLVSYSNEAKQALLGVKPETLENYGAVSEQTVEEMATGALKVSSADLSVAISGIAGPGGGSAEKPAGTVWFAWGRQSAAGPQVDAAVHRLAGDREAVRWQSVLLALDGIRERLKADG
jgi:nicotinamide-nucleotide amidase